MRTLDFEKALGQLNNLDQSMLISAFYLGHTRKEMADTTGISERAANYKIPMALDALATVLERLDLL